MGYLHGSIGQATLSLPLQARPSMTPNRMQQTNKLWDAASLHFSRLLCMSSWLQEAFDIYKNILGRLRSCSSGSHHATHLQGVQYTELRESWKISRRTPSRDL